MPLLKLLGVGGKALSAGGAALKAAAKLPVATRALLAARGVLPAVAKIKPPLPPASPGTAPGERRARAHHGRLGDDHEGHDRDRHRGLALDQARRLSRRQRQPGPRAPDLAPARRQRHRRPQPRDDLPEPRQHADHARLEQQVANAVRAGETVQYTVQPIYRGAELIPRAFTLRATGSGGFRLHVSILNKVP